MAALVAAKVVLDCEGRPIRLTDERLAHIGDHPEMLGLESAIEDVLRSPERVVESLSDRQKGRTLWPAGR
ncbi:MAG: hypothetical protein E6J68_03190 [Deltaproteobacteria bacterium]|nr:MAG: hypothetical protein E6J68_03190 [Deltaproteobacteria bacterium]